MATACSQVGSSTSTGWKRRSRAGSFSMCWRYSSMVVAPMQCSSPRARAGLRMLLASMAPPVAPAPTRVCISSMNSSTWPSCSVTSLMTFLSRSSNSPRYLVPAISAPMSRAMTRLSFRPSGTSPSTRRRARPSTTAVLPTPGAPISTGLFLVRRLRIWMVRRISSSRPMMGSILPARASGAQVAGVGVQGRLLAVRRAGLVVALVGLVGAGLLEGAGQLLRRSRRRSSARCRHGRGRPPGPAAAPACPPCRRRPWPASPPPAAGAAGRGRRWARPRAGPSGRVRSSCSAVRAIRAGSSSRPRRTLVASPVSASRAHSRCRGSSSACFSS